MASPLYLVYWDANCLLRLVNKHPESWQLLESIVRRSQDKDDPLRIVTSTLSTTEVAYAADEQLADAALKGQSVKRVLDDAGLAIIDAFWNPGGPIELADYTATVGRKAREVLRRTNGRVRGFDAVHVATAIVIGVSEMHTYDQHILGASLTAPFSIGNPKGSFQEPLPGMPEKT